MMTQRPTMGSLRSSGIGSPRTAKEERELGGVCSAIITLSFPRSAWERTTGTLGVPSPRCPEPRRSCLARRGASRAVRFHAERGNEKQRPFYLRDSLHVPHNLLKIRRRARQVDRPLARRPVAALVA